MIDPEATTEALRWLRYAEDDLDTAAMVARGDGLVPRHGCFHSQQAAEKALKAALVLEGLAVPFIHDLGELLELLPDGWSLPSSPVELERLTEWGSEARYPGDWADPTAEDAVQAEAEARTVYEAIAREFASRGVTDA